MLSNFVYRIAAHSVSWEQGRRFAFGEHMANRELLL